MTTMAKVTAKYQITIPIRVRKELGIVPGSEVDISKEGEKYVLVVDPIEAIRKKWRGRLRDSSTTMAYLDEIRGSVQ
ncbi:MAG: AbrB/MazE/SpoVT family DNA-binding domain-containing protein [Deltaproteobacteria bacterium]|nr:AbrB/MazE/SpoVT family DNA-binding domain-containing protein [Deltaproteobacteria bacterium]